MRRGRLPPHIYWRRELDGAAAAAPLRAPLPGRGRAGPGVPAHRDRPPARRPLGAAPGHRRPHRRRRPRCRPLPATRPPLLAIVGVGGFFRFLMRRAPHRRPATSSTTCATTSSRTCSGCRSRYFQAHRTGDLMSRATNDLNAVRMMIGPAVMYAARTRSSSSSSRSALMLVDRRAADAARADPAAVRVDLGRSTSAGDPQALRADPGAALRASARWRRKRCPASASCARTGRRRPSWSASGAPTRSTSRATAS